MRGDGGAGQGGVLVLYEGVHPFSAAEKQLHRILSELGGTALQRSRLVADAERRTETEDVLASARERLQRSLDPETILRTALTELGHVLNPELATIELHLEQEGREGTAVTIREAGSRGNGADRSPDAGDTEDDRA